MRSGASFGFGLLLWLECCSSWRPRARPLATCAFSGPPRGRTSGSAEPLSSTLGLFAAAWATANGACARAHRQRSVRGDVGAPPMARPVSLEGLWRVDGRRDDSRLPMRRRTSTALTRLRKRSDPPDRELDQSSATRRSPLRTTVERNKRHSNHKASRKKTPLT